LFEVESVFFNLFTSMRKFILLLSLLPILTFAQNNPDSLIFKKISDEILINGQAYDNLRQITKEIGPRLSGSLNYDKATIWAESKLREAGAEKVWLQEVMVPVWVRGQESLKMK